MRTIENGNSAFAGVTPNRLTPPESFESRASDVHSLIMAWCQEVGIARFQEQTGTSWKTLLDRRRNDFVLPFRDYLEVGMAIGRLPHEAAQLWESAAFADLRAAWLNSNEERGRARPFGLLQLLLETGGVAFTRESLREGMDLSFNDALKLSHCKNIPWALIQPTLVGMVAAGIIPMQEVQTLEMLWADPQPVSKGTFEVEVMALAKAKQRPSDLIASLLELEGDRAARYVRITIAGERGSRQLSSAEFALIYARTPDEFSKLLELRQQEVQQELVGRGSHKVGVSYVTRKVWGLQREDIRVPTDELRNYESGEVTSLTEPQITERLREACDYKMAGCLKLFLDFEHPLAVPAVINLGADSLGGFKPLGRQTQIDHRVLKDVRDGNSILSLPLFALVIEVAGHVLSDQQEAAWHFSAAEYFTRTYSASIVVAIAHHIAQSEQVRTFYWRSLGEKDVTWRSRLDHAERVGTLSDRSFDEFLQVSNIDPLSLKGQQLTLCNSGVPKSAPETYISELYAAIKKSTYMTQLAALAALQDSELQAVRESRHAWEGHTKDSLLECKWRLEQGLSPGVVRYQAELVQLLRELPGVTRDQLMGLIHLARKDLGRVCNPLREPCRNNVFTLLTMPRDDAVDETVHVLVGNLNPYTTGLAALFGSPQEDVAILQRLSENLGNRRTGSYCGTELMREVVLEAGPTALTPHELGHLLKLLRREVLKYVNLTPQAANHLEKFLEFFASKPDPKASLAMLMPLYHERMKALDFPRQATNLEIVGRVLNCFLPRDSGTL